MTSYLQYNPQKVFESAKDGVIVEKTLAAVVAAGAAVQVIAAVTGKSLLILGYEAQTNSAANAQINLQDGSGGTVRAWHWLPQSTSNQMLIVPKTPGQGLFSTTAGNGLFAGSTLEFIINVHYLEYTP